MKYPGREICLTQGTAAGQNKPMPVAVSPCNMRFAQTYFRLAALVAWSFGGSVLGADDAKPVAPKAAGLVVAELKRDTQIDFEKEVLPFLKNNCLACHNTTKAKASLNLETPQLILKGGDSGPSVVPGRSAESLIFKAAAHLDPELIMPPKDNKANAVNLAPENLALLKLWIEQGAKGEVRAVSPVNWLDHPATLAPMLALALSQDGQFAACGRGNRIDVYHVPSSRLLARLADPRLHGLTNAAHRDLVQSLAFNPEGTLLASAGFREVNLWRRPRDVKEPISPVTNLGSLVALSPDRKWLATPNPSNDIALYDRASGRRAGTLQGHSNTVTSLAFSPDNRRLLSGALDQTLRVWNVAEGTSEASVETPAAVHAVVWTGHEQQLASGGHDGLVRVWNLAAARPAEEKTDTTPPAEEAGKAAGAIPSTLLALALVRECKGHTGVVSALEVFPGGKELLSGGADGTVRQWSLEDGRALRQVQHDGAVTAVAVRPDGKRFASAGTNGIAMLWNAADGLMVARLAGDRYARELVAELERGLVVAKADLEFSKKSLESAESEHKQQVERVARASQTNSVTEKIFAEKEKALKDADLAKTGAGTALTNLLAEMDRVTTNYAKADRAAREAATQAKAASEKATLAQLAAERAAASKSDASRIASDTASVAERTKAALENAGAAKDTARRIAEESAAVAAKSKDFAEAVGADADMKTRLGAETKAAVEKAIEEVAALSFAAGQLKPGYDKTLAEAPEKRKAATNQVESATKALVAAENEFKKAETRKSVTNHELELAHQAAKRASDSMAAAKTALAAVETARKETDEAIERARKTAATTALPVRALAFSPDGVTLATLGDDRRPRTWSAENGAPFEVLGRTFTNINPTRAEGGAPGPGSLAFRDAQTLWAGGDDGSLTAWALNPEWTLERTIGSGEADSSLSDRVNAIRFSPDGRTLATGGGEPTRSGEIKLWNVANGKLVKEFGNVHSDAVLGLDFSSDGRYLASAAADRFVRVTDLRLGRMVKIFEGHTSYVLGVSWKRDGRTLASAGADNVIKIWDFVTGERRKNIEGAGKEVTSISFVGATGEALAASGDGQVRLLRENGELVRNFEGAPEFLNAAAATPDGQVVVAGGQDGVLHVWNGANKQRLATLRP